MAETITTYRVYWWIRGVSGERVAGPWWFRDFKDKMAARRFIYDHRRYCREIRLAEFEGQPPARFEGRPPAHTLMNLRPPKDAEIWVTNGEPVLAD